MAFATSAEAAYPVQLCDALAEGLAQELGMPPPQHRSRASGSGGRGRFGPALRGA